MRKIIIFILIVIMSHLLYGYLSASDAGIVAKADGTVITENDVQAFINANTDSGKSPGRESAIESLISEALFYAEAKAKGLAERPDVKEKIERFARGILADELAVEELRPKVSVTDSEVEDYYNNNKKRFTEPVMVNFFLARISKKDRKGNDVGMETPQCIVDAWRKNPGLTVGEAVKLCEKDPDILIEKLTPQHSRKGTLGGGKLEDVVFSLKTDEVSDIVEDDKYFNVVKMVFVKPERLYELKMVRDSIIKKLQDGKYTVLLDDYIKELKKKYKVEVY